MVKKIDAKSLKFRCKILDVKLYILAAKSLSVQNLIENYNEIIDKSRGIDRVT